MHTDFAAAQSVGHQAHNQPRAITKPKSSYPSEKLQEYMRARTIRIDLRDKFNFTNPELLLASHMVQGMTVAELSTVLQKSKNTIQEQVNSMVGKIGVYKCIDSNRYASLVLRRCITAPIDPDDLPFIENLSARELQTASYILRGFNTVAISEKMGIAQHTAQHHQQSILGKLGINNRYQLFALMFVDCDEGEFKPGVAPATRTTRLQPI